MIVQTRFEIQVPDIYHKSRLEDFLLDQFGTISKMYLRELVKLEKCEVNGRNENVGYRLRTNDFVEILIDKTRGTAMRPEEISLDIMFEDPDLIVVNKPAGMLMHPSHCENSGTLLNALVYHFNETGRNRISRGQPLSGVIRPGLPHRLDKLTSGLVVVAKTALAHRRLSDSFMKKKVEKRYLALVEGSVKDQYGTIEAPIGRYADLKYWSVKEDGKHSVSKFWVRERYSNANLIELEPVTGRTNQLRIHCELIGHPIIGDVKRGGRPAERLFLHAFRLSFPHPATGKRMIFETSIPDGFNKQPNAEPAPVCHRTAS